MDLIDQLGELALASRLHRLADTLQKDVTRIYAELGLDFEARWFPVLAALRDGRSRSVTGLAVDSRAVRDGYLFAALPGVNVHGASFVEAALQNGASIASLLLTTDAMVCEIPEKKEAPMPPGGGGMPPM